MPGVLHTLRIHFRSKIDSFPPLPAFALASHYEWQEEQRILSSLTLGSNLFSEDSLEQLKSVSSHALVKLFDLHRRRRDILIESLQLKNPSGGTFTINDGVMFEQSNCRQPRLHLDTPRWDLFQYHLSREMEKKPDGSSIRERGFWKRPEFDRLWSAACSRCTGYETSLVNKLGLKDEIIRIIDALPKTI